MRQIKNEAFDPDYQSLFYGFLRIHLHIQP